MEPDKKFVGLAIIQEGSKTQTPQTVPVHQSPTEPQDKHVHSGFIRPSLTETGHTLADRYRFESYDSQAMECILVLQGDGVAKRSPTTDEHNAVQAQDPAALKAQGQAKVPGAAIEEPQAEYGYVEPSVERTPEARKRRKKKTARKRSQANYVPLPYEPPSPLVCRVKQKASKQKTRPGELFLSGYDHFDSSNEVNDEGLRETPLSPQIPQPRKVKASAGIVFSALFDKAKKRGKMRWQRFENDMKSLDFTIESDAEGSRITFTRPKDEPNQKSVVFHKKPKITRHYQDLLHRR
ncbi:hypothetical protein F4825DRAFT_475791 [Nemania diffusa]|nr:hypothetical protein F4825DRAFT_475791 [Nemania diffusa]